ncbi:P63C domain-containing protein [Pedobacter jejuensis]|uniref:Bacteriophage Mx8 p63 C-terminal domain-containing protein n=1 Tax=Pedobacter jejuensis TaxID=1268550 RepID=A0A3N0BPB1_9SPHI|nr:P63C domain-containing protein [Pedobacter jejuensis]RNL50165.1 hypothetical protein D7004_18300 [Pedobacter jejuensis]
MSKILKAEYGSDKTPLIIGEIEIPCYVLSDGTRVLSRNGMQKAIGYKGTSGDWLTNFVGSKAVSKVIKPEISAGLFEVIEFQRNNAGGSATMTYGYEATKLIDFCDALIDLKKAGVLKPNQIVYADQAEIIIRSVAKVGIIALIDEATGYQYKRESNELQVILKTLISDEILAYQKQFQLSFYKEIFKLWNIPFTPENIKRKPRFIGHITNRYVYSNLPKGSFVLEELKKKTPKNEKGNYKVQFHRSLTDIGKEHLKKVLYTVEALASISEDKKAFDRFIQEKYGQKEIPFSDLDDLDNEPDSPKGTPPPKKISSGDTAYDDKFNKALKKGKPKD